MNSNSIQVLSSIRHPPYSPNLLCHLSISSPVVLHLLLLLRQHCPGNRQTELGHGEPEACSSRYHQSQDLEDSNVKLWLRPLSITVSRADQQTCSSLRAVNINDEFGPYSWVNNTLSNSEQVIAQWLKMLIWVQGFYVGHSCAKHSLWAVDALLVMIQRAKTWLPQSSKDYLFKSGK